MLTQRAISMKRQDPNIFRRDGYLLLLLSHPPAIPFKEQDLAENDIEGRMQPNVFLRQLANAQLQCNHKHIFLPLCKLEMCNQDTFSAMLNWSHGVLVKEQAQNSANKFLHSFHQIRK